MFVIFFKDNIYISHIKVLPQSIHLLIRTKCSLNRYSWGKKNHCSFYNYPFYELTSQIIIILKAHASSRKHYISLSRYKIIIIIKEISLKSTITQLFHKIYIHIHLYYGKCFRGKK